jgi:hypothetical protein
MNTQASTADQSAPAKPKGSRPSHRISRVVEKDGAKDYQDVGALWPHKDGQGFSLRLKADLKAGDNLIIRSNKGGN